MWTPSRRGFMASLAALPLLAPSLRGWAAELPDLPRLPEVPVARGADRVARLRLTAAPLPNPAVSNLLGYNGGFPGPLLRLKAGETVEIAFDNRTADVSNLHFHGLDVSPEGNSDNPFLQIPAGQGMTYRLDLPQGHGGLHWYHPHVHGRAGVTAAAQMRGLVGPILIDGGDGDAGLPHHADRVLVLHDRDIQNGMVAKAGLSDWSTGHEGSLLTVNGVPRARLSCEQPWLRLRIVNASNARYWQLRASDARQLWRIAQDGPWLAAPEALDSLLLPPGARSEIMIPMAGRGDFDLVYHYYPRQGQVYVPDFAVLHVQTMGAGIVLPSLPARLPAPAAFPTHQVARLREVPIGLMNICGRQYDPGHDDFQAALGDTERWLLVNTDLMDHPMHLHTWRFEPLSLNGAPWSGPRRSIDTLNLRPGDRVEIGLHFVRNPGRSLFHCHIVEHATQGMMATVRVAA